MRDRRLKLEIEEQNNREAKSVMTPTMGSRNEQEQNAREQATSDFEIEDFFSHCHDQGVLVYQKTESPAKHRRQLSVYSVPV
jgi:hypothetical protein